MGLPPYDAPENSGETDLTNTLHISSLRSVPDFVSEKSLLDSLSSEEFNVLKDLSKDSGMFISLAGPGKGARFLLDTDCITIGRDSSSEIFLDDVTVSRSHAQIKREDMGAFVLVDNASLNGTYLNNVSVEKNVLKNGDEIQIGKFHFVFIGGTK